MQKKSERFVALDVLRGLTMVIMALDHSRDFFALGYVYFAPTDIDLTNLEVFFTRWITHFAAPTFMFLAGIGLFFASGRRTKNELAYLAISRGVWLIFLELTLVGFFWSFSPEFMYQPKIAVLFAIGVAMICVGVLIYLPKYLIAVIALSMIFGHNALDGIHADSFGVYAWMWHLIHMPGNFLIGDIEVRVVYPFVPWIGVMALGYLFGPVTKKPRELRKKIFLLSGLALLVFGIVLRFYNNYGDPIPWMQYESFEMTLMSFLNFAKYPPSLIYLSVLMGFAMILMTLFDRDLGKWSYPLRDFGQVPFFFYVIHIPLLHVGGILLALSVFGDAHWLFGAPLGHSPEAYSYGSELLPTYMAWIIVLVALYYPSRWFADLKKRRKDWWLSYL
ncbi:MAG: heparan-alpha-glucosaminide N-acetyltransferase domain-containing protein [Campylobacterota bacterium]|nr:heparan-alpha-glucosaminide N-acetyltransferase domain-containing protein [Campylobacterota bacterium]